jgi:hypothetical protein
MTTLTDKPLSEKDEDELALRRQRALANGDGQHLIFEIELQRRLMKEQHELNKTLVEKQSRLLRWSIIVGFTGMIIGAILGAALTTIGPVILSRVLSPAQTVSTIPSSPPSTETLGQKTQGQEAQKHHDTPGTKEITGSVSSKPPPNEKYK